MLSASTVSVFCHDSSVFLVRWFPLQSSLRKCRGCVVCLFSVTLLPMIARDQGGYLDSCFMVREICGSIEFSEL